MSHYHVLLPGALFRSSAAVPQTKGSLENQLHHPLQLDRFARSSMINISTEQENGQGSLKLQYATLSPNENPIKLDNYPNPFEVAVYESPFSSYLRQHHTEPLALQSFLGHTFLTACPHRLDDN